MKTTLEDLKTRRSIRSYKAEQITDEELDAVLEAGTYAPTGMGAGSGCVHRDRTRDPWVRNGKPAAQTPKKRIHR
ncbi:MAG: nitroreductase family protein [Spirochaetaceae bacterium]|jgi:nitroreductase|nr:nitroreductase family protein [Spirochaetaceae bacterium]